MPMEDIHLPGESLDRRGFLKLSGLGLLALATPVDWGRTAIEATGGQLGRVTAPTVDVFVKPAFASESVGRRIRDDVLKIEGAFVGAPPPDHNKVWYLAEGEGFIHSSAIQPVRDEPNLALDVVPGGGVLAEVSVPYVDALWRSYEGANRAYRLYYHTTHWIENVSVDPSGQAWYRIAEDKWGYSIYAHAQAFRPVPLAELIPISPEVPAQEKRIVVDLRRQWVYCYEGGNLVFSTKVSTGRIFSTGDFRTPVGDYVTFRKRASRHMAAGNLATGYDLPGVPWVAYITESGVSFHGTYWHNDFGTPRSHGCINMTPSAAKWLFRWTTPLVPSEEREVWVDYGTSVEVRG